MERKILLPEGIGLHTIRCKFVELDNPKSVMRLLGYEYDDTKSHHKNCVDFYNLMQEENMLCELWDAMNALK